MSGNNDFSRNYIIITPCKNEEKNLPYLIESIKSQIIRPVAWVFIDDGSSDTTPLILKEASENNNWIRIIRMEEKNKRDLGLHLAKISKIAFDFAIEYCKKKKIEYNYLGNIDADLTIENTFYKNLIIEFEKDQNLGLASGGIRLTIGDKVVHVKGLPEDEPSGGDMLIRRKCFEDCGGIPQSYAYDTVLKAKARLNGWKTKRFEDNIATEARDVGNAESYSKGFFHMGKSSYYLNFHPVHIFARGILKSFRKPYYGGIIFIVGYLYSLVKRDRQIEDDNIKKYFWNKWKKVYKHRLSSRVIHEAIE